jgi:glycosyltransferase involved in cell wall biosynthesis
VAARFIVREGTTPVPACVVARGHLNAFHVLAGKRIAVVVPAYNEERLLARTVTAIPAFVDLVVVVDDASTDRTAAVAVSLQGTRVRLERHAKNGGVGAAIVTGYRAALSASSDVVAVMAGDAQMHPDDLLALVTPVLSGDVDYAKGDRLGHPEVLRIMPAQRRRAGVALSWLTRHAAGIAELSDSQCGYTAISRDALLRIDLELVYRRYGYPNDLIGHLARAGCRIRDVPVRPVYAGESSGVRPWHVAVILALLARVAYLRARATTALVHPSR